MKQFLLAVCLTLVTMNAVAADDEVIGLNIEIFRNGERISNPMVAMKPGSDASVLQGIEPDTGISVVFHSTHLREDGAEMTVDIDAGNVADGGDRNQLEHVRSDHLVMPWNAPYEFVFSGPDGASIRLLVTPTRTTRAALTSRRK